MRFETRYDKWLTGLLISVGVISIGVPFDLAAHGQLMWVLFLWPVIFFFAISAALPQYYEVRENGLFIRQGWKKALLPYSAISELRIWHSALSAAVFSTHRLVITATSEKFVIAVAEQERFLTEVANRAPHLDQSPSGLKSRTGSHCLC
jgi:hypothetical protein